VQGQTTRLLKTGVFFSNWVEGVSTGFTDVSRVFSRFLIFFSASCIRSANALNAASAEAENCVFSGVFSFFSISVPSVGLPSLHIKSDRETYPAPFF